MNSIIAAGGTVICNKISPLVLPRLQQNLSTPSSGKCLTLLTAQALYPVAYLFPQLKKAR